MAYTARHKFSDKLLDLLTEKPIQFFYQKNSKRKVNYKVSVTDNGLELRRATSKGEYPDKAGYKWFVEGNLDLETIDKVLDVVNEDFNNKRTCNSADPRVEKFKVQYYSFFFNYGEEYASYLLEEPESFLENVRVREKYANEDGDAWEDVEYKRDVDEWVCWSINSEDIYEYVAEQMICDDDSEREEGQYGSDEFEELVGKAGGKEMNYFCGGIARLIKSCVGYVEGYYGAIGLRFDHRFYRQFKDFDEYKGAINPNKDIPDSEPMVEGLWYSLLSIGDTPDSIADNISIREDDFAFVESIEERQSDLAWNWNKVCCDAIAKINKELGPDAVFFTYADYENCVAEYVVGKKTFASWFSKKYPETDLKSWLIENIVNKDGLYYDRSYCTRLSFEEWWKTFESEN